MNGALTIGTLDGANVEIRTEVGAENFFLFGLTTEEVAERSRRGYRPYEHYETDPELRDVIDLVRGGLFSGGDPELFRPLIDGLLGSDPYFVMADYAAYSKCQQEVDRTYRDQASWQRMSILNSARSGKFSSDRTIREYCNEIWHVKPVPVRLLSQADVQASFLQ